MEYLLWVWPEVRRKRLFLVKGYSRLWCPSVHTYTQHPYAPMEASQNPCSWMLLLARCSTILSSRSMHYVGIPEPTVHSSWRVIFATMIIGDKRPKAKQRWRESQHRVPNDTACACKMLSLFVGMQSVNSGWFECHLVNRKFSFWRNSMTSCLISCKVCMSSAPQSRSST